MKVLYKTLQHIHTINKKRIGGKQKENGSTKPRRNDRPRNKNTNETLQSRTKNEKTTKRSKKHIKKEEEEKMKTQEFVEKLDQLIEESRLEPETLIGILSLTEKDMIQQMLKEPRD